MNPPPTRHGDQPVCLLLAEEVWGSALHATRSLGRAGVDVYVATAGHGSAIYRRSRYCTGAADIVTSDPQVFCSLLRHWVEQHVHPNQSVVIIPLSDRLVEYLHNDRQNFSERYRLSIPSVDITEVLLNKADSFRLAEQAGLAVPEWIEIKSREDTESMPRFSFPVAVRPTSWATIGSEYFKIRLCRDQHELDHLLASTLDDGAEVIVQEYLDAPEHAVEFAIVWRSESRSVTAVCTGRKRRQSSPDGGVMAWGETAALPDVETGALRFLNESGFTGLGGIEFIHTQGHLWFIEFNPRLEAIHFLASAAGMDTVVMEFRDLAFGAVPESVSEQLPAAAWVGSAWLNRLLANPKDWTVAILDRIKFARSQTRVKAVVDVRDPLPSLALATRLTTRAVRSVATRRSS